VTCKRLRAQIHIRPPHVLACSVQHQLLGIDRSIKLFAHAATGRNIGTAQSCFLTFAA
jgi:hypothetical protein